MEFQLSYFKPRKIVIIVEPLTFRQKCKEFQWASQFLFVFEGEEFNSNRLLLSLKRYQIAKNVYIFFNAQSECISLQWARPRFDPWVGKIPWRRAWQPTPAFLPGESHGQRSLAGYSPCGHKESGVTKCTHRHTQTYVNIHTHIYIHYTKLCVLTLSGLVLSDSLWPYGL